MKPLMISILMFGLLIGGCSKKKTENNTPTYSVEFKVGGLRPTDIGTAAASTYINENKLIAENTNSGWAKLVGLKLKVLSIEIDGEESHSSVVDYRGEGGKVIDIESDSYHEAVPISGNVKQGNYNRIRINFKNEYDIKAYGYSSNGTCYTKLEGVVCMPGILDPSQLIGFDYYHYNFMYVTTAKSATDTDDEISESTSLTSSVDIGPSNSNPLFQIRLDTYRLITFWDGTGERTGLAPFSWSNNNGLPANSFFPDHKPNFGISYIPTYISLNDPGETKGEVYISSPDLNAVENYDADSYDLGGLQYLTLTFKSNGDYVGARVVNFNHDQDRLMQFISVYSVDSKGYSSFFNGEWYNLEQRYFRDRLVTQFRRTAIGQVIESSYFNGDDCGKYILDNQHPEWGNRVRPCLLEKIPMYFKRVR